MNVCPCCKTTHDSTACPQPSGEGLGEMNCSVAVKPPLGVAPQNVWEWQRCRDLARATHQYFEAGMRPNDAWIDELAKRFPNAR